jgi:hypothetical protein
VTLSDAFKDTLTSFIPVTVQPSSRNIPWVSSSLKNQPVTPMEQLAGAFGFRVSRFSPITETHRLARQWVHDNVGIVKGVTEDKGAYPVSKFQQLRYALEDSDFARAKSEYEKVKQQEKLTGAAITKRFEESIKAPFTASAKMDLKFRNSLQGGDRKTYDAAIERRKEINRRYHQLLRKIHPPTQ